MAEMLTECAFDDLFNATPFPERALGNVLLAIQYQWQL
jgi:hypothetical protein